MSKILIDTNAYSAFMAGDERVLQMLAEADTTFLSVIVMGELHAGFRGGSRLQANKKDLAGFLKKPTVHVLDVGLETAEVFGQIKDSLKRAGSPVPINDVWLAAQAVETGAVIVSYDEHFKRVQGIRLWDVLAQEAERDRSREPRTA